LERFSESQYLARVLYITCNIALNQANASISINNQKIGDTKYRNTITSETQTQVHHGQLISSVRLLDNHDLPEAKKSLKKLVISSYTNNLVTLKIANDNKIKSKVLILNDK